MTLDERIKELGLEGLSLRGRIIKGRVAVQVRATGDIYFL